MGFRGYLQALKEQGGLVCIERQVSTHFELAAIAKKVQDKLGRAVLFDRVSNYDVRVASNLYGGRNCYATLLGVEPRKVTQTYLARKLGGFIPVQTVARSPAHEYCFHPPLDLHQRLPIPLHFAGDAGPYITGGVVIARNPCTGVLNLSFNRLQLLGEDKLAIFMAPGQHLTQIYAMTVAERRSLEVAIAIGVNPYVALAAAAKIPAEDSELTLAGALRQQPIETVNCITVDLQVPADSEIVLEGSISPLESAVEGPMGEVLQLYGGISRRPVIALSLLAHRDNPIYHTILAGSIEEHTLQAIPFEADLLSQLRPIYPGVGINLLPFMAVCAISAGPPGEVGTEVVQSLIRVALAHVFVKLVVVVNDDVDIDDANDVLWAVAARADLSKNILLMPQIPGLALDPFLQDGMVAGMGIDATVPRERLERFQRRTIPGYRQLDLAALIHGEGVTL